MSTITVEGVTINTGLFINNEWVKGHGEPLETVNPATEEVIATVQTASKEDVDIAVKAAREAFETTWGTECSGQERGRLLFALADQMEKRIDELVALEIVDAGKPVAWARADMEDSIACLRYYAGAADKIQGSTIEMDDKNKYAVARKEPIGVAAQIVPWNYPILMMAWKVGPALAAGVSIVFKPAEQTPLSTLLFAEMVKDAGYPPGVFNVLNGVGRVTGDALARHMDIDKIAFTGSTPTGRRIACAAAESNLKSVTLELGGKSPNIIFEDADLKEAAKWAAFGVYENMGQSCNAGSRILVQESVYDKFLPLFVEAAQAFQVGDTKDQNTFQGPQISKVQFDKILGYLEQGKKEAKLITGGNRFGNKGYFVEPTVFGDVDMTMKIGQEEIFGPVASLIKFKTEAEAIQIANDTSFGLAAAVHSMNYAQVNRVTRKLKAGTVWINQYTILSHQIPFGGYKQSGWGRELGLEGLEPYLATKAVHHYYGPEFEWPIKL
ncbi:hypothetical protein CcaverHIS631_0209520 [Cutaneotrichosporon cavernicola]|nr:hypothetical protein CcaverHIS631_0209520 [Cutaneotrichosporon cavernicola]BEJ05139.1 hypothetical protein CcaverHIS641_0209560 [Cutaneotrichosporon cavernicola]